MHFHPKRKNCHNPNGSSPMRNQIPKSGQMKTLSLKHSRRSKEWDNRPCEAV